MRVVSLVPSHTQSVADLGGANLLVGRTRFCIHPSDVVRSVPAVGGTKDAKMERILATRPDLVLMDEDENPRALYDALVEADIDVLVSRIATMDDAAQFVESLGRRMELETGTSWAKRIRDAARPSPYRATVFCPIWARPWMTFHRQSYCHDVLLRAGLMNAFGEHPGSKYFEVTPDDVVQSGAEWTLLPSEPFPFHTTRVSTEKLGACGKQERVRLVDGEALTWFGTRSAAAVLTLRRETADIGRPTP